MEQETITLTLSQRATAHLLQHHLDAHHFVETYVGVDQWIRGSLGHTLHADAMLQSQKFWDGMRDAVATALPDVLAHREQLQKAIADNAEPIMRAVAGLADDVGNVHNQVMRVFSGKSNDKGIATQDAFLALLADALPDAEVVDTSKLPNHGDVHILRTDRPPILLDVKAYKSNVPFAEVDEHLWKDMRMNEAHGIMVSVDSGIANRRNHQWEIVDGKFVAVYLTKNRYDMDQVKAAIATIDTASAYLQRARADGLVITDDDADAIRRGLDAHQDAIAAVAHALERERRKLLKINLRNSVDATLGACVRGKTQTAAVAAAAAAPEGNSSTAAAAAAHAAAEEDDNDNDNTNATIGYGCPYCCNKGSWSRWSANVRNHCWARHDVDLQSGDLLRLTKARHARKFADDSSQASD